MNKTDIDKETEYHKITEFPGLQATREQLDRLYQRYRFAAQYCKGSDIVEVACGTGIGLGYLARFAGKVVGLDIDSKNLQIAQASYRTDSNVRVMSMDAHKLEFENNSFDVALLYEAVYYLKDPVACFSEMNRILRDNGVCIVCSVNREWKDFHPSPYTVKYYSSTELHSALKSVFGNNVSLFGGFPVNNAGAKNRLFSMIKRTAVNLNLIPGSLWLRAYLKRIFIGEVMPIPDSITDEMVSCDPPVKIPSDLPASEYKIIYAVARKLK